MIFSESLYENVSRASGPRVSRASRPRKKCFRGQDGHGTRGQDARDTPICSFHTGSESSVTLWLNSLLISLDSPAECGDAPFFAG
jgi:hypothetical protein